MRTQDELAERFKSVYADDFLGFEAIEYLKYMDAKTAKQFLKPDADVLSKWSTCDQSAIADVMIEYMPFAWKKANNQRGISAARSIGHYKAWLWIQGNPEALELSERISNYYDYGKPQLRMICEHLGIDAKQWDVD